MKNPKFFTIGEAEQMIGLLETTLERIKRNRQGGPSRGSASRRLWRATRPAAGRRQWVSIQAQGDSLT